MQCIVRSMGVHIRRDPCIIRRLVERVICMTCSRIIYRTVHEVLVIPHAAADWKIFIKGLYLHARWFRRRLLSDRRRSCRRSRRCVRSAPDREDGLLAARRRGVRHCTRSNSCGSCHRRTARHRRAVIACHRGMAHVQRQLDAVRCIFIRAEDCTHAGDRRLRVQLRLR